MTKLHWSTITPSGCTVARSKDQDHSNWRPPQHTWVWFTFGTERAVWSHLFPLFRFILFSVYTEIEKKKFKEDKKICFCCNTSAVIFKNCVLQSIDWIQCVHTVCTRCGINIIFLSNLWRLMCFGFCKG